MFIRDSISNIDSFNISASELRELKSTLFISGGLSLNTFYIKNKLENLFDNPLKFFYKINNQWNNNLYNKYDSIEMVVFDNYPKSKKDIEEFQLIMENAEKKQHSYYGFYRAG